MTILKSFPVIILLAMTTTSSPPPCGVGVRGRNYGANIQPQVNPFSTSQNRDPNQLQILKKIGFRIPNGTIPQRSASAKIEQQDDGSLGEARLDGDRDFYTDFRNREIARPDLRLLRRNSNRPRVSTISQNFFGSLHLQGRRPGHLTGGRHEGEYGYNYQEGTGDVQIHQHIHEYQFADYARESDTCTRSLEKICTKIEMCIPTKCKGVTICCPELECNVLTASTGKGRCVEKKRARFWIENP